MTRFIRKTLATVITTGLIVVMGASPVLAEKAGYPDAESLPVTPERVAQHEQVSAYRNQLQLDQIASALMVSPRVVDPYNAETLPITQERLAKTLQVMESRLQYRTDLGAASLEGRTLQGVEPLWGVGSTLYVRYNNVLLRSAMLTGYVRGHVHRGTSVEVLGWDWDSNGRMWDNVRVLDGDNRNVRGWIRSDLLTSFKPTAATGAFMPQIVTFGGESVLFEPIDTQMRTDFSGGAFFEARDSRERVNFEVSFYSPVIDAIGYEAGDILRSFAGTASERVATNVVLVDDDNFLAAHQERIDAILTSINEYGISNLQELSVLLDAMACCGDYLQITPFAWCGDMSRLVPGWLTLPTGERIPAYLCLSCGSIVVFVIV